MADLGDFTAAVREHEREQRATPDTFGFFGETFAIADEISPLPLMKFAAAAESGLESDTMEGLAAMYELLRSCLAAEPHVDPETGRVIAHGWPRLERLVVEQRIDSGELLRLCAALIEADTGRPTERPSFSQDGPSTGTPSSRPTSGRERTSAADWDARMRDLGMVPAMELAAAVGSSPG